jgi:hypothetical protein
MSLRPTRPPQVVRPVWPAWAVKEASPGEVPHIATFTGNSLKDVEAILDAHRLGRDIRFTEAAALKLGKRTKL